MMELTFFTMQEDSQNASEADDRASGACSLQAIGKEDVQSVDSSCLNSTKQAPCTSQTKLNSASNDVVSNSSKDERQDYSHSKKQSVGDEELLNQQEHLVTVDIFADCVSNCQ